MTYTLYYMPGACSLAIHVLLNEIGADFTAINQKGKLTDPDFLKLNPRAQIPLLVVDHEPVKEGGALLTWLADEHKSPLLPVSGMERAKALEWLMWCNATLHPACSKIFWLKKPAADSLDPKAKEELQKLFLAQVQSLWDEADARLAKTKYLAGDTLTLGDILLTVISNWGVGTPGPNAQRVIAEVKQRPAYQKSVQAEQETKAAA